jgi:hypothetical protein
MFQNPALRVTGRFRAGVVALIAAALLAPAAGAVPTMPSATVCPAGPPTCDFTEIQPALDAVFDDGSVTVAPGVYDAGFTISRNVTLIGADATTTNASGATVTVGAGASAVIQGLALTDAVGVQLTNAGSLTLRDAIVRNGALGPGTATTDAGAIANTGSLVIRRSTITGRGNDVGGIYNGGDILIVDSTLRDSLGTGVGALWNEGSATIRSSQILDNDAAFDGGIANWPGASLVVRDSLIRGNEGQGPGALRNSGAAVIADTTIANNQLNGVDNEGSLTLTRVIISGWGSGLGSDGGLVNTGSAVVRRSILDGQNVVYEANRTPPAIANRVGGTMTLIDSSVRRSPGGGIVNEGTLTVRASIIRRNTSDGSGAGIRNSGSAVVRRSVIRRNRADGSGGGVWNSGTLDLIGSQVRRNQALDLAGTGIFGGGVANVLGGTVTQVASTVAQNDPDNCVGC